MVIDYLMCSHGHASLVVEWLLTSLMCSHSHASLVVEWLMTI